MSCTVRLYSHACNMCLSYFANSLTINISSAIFRLSGLNYKLSWPLSSVSTEFYWTHTTAGAWWHFSVEVPIVFMGKWGIKAENSEIKCSFYPFQKVNELLLCYTLLGLERTPWSASHIFHSLTHQLTWAICRLQNLSVRSFTWNCIQFCTCWAFEIIVPNQTSFLKLLLSLFSLDASKTKRKWTASFQ